MIILNNIELMSIISKTMDVLKTVNGFDDLLYNMLDEEGEYKEFLAEIEEDVMKLILRSEHIIMEVIDR